MSKINIINLEESIMDDKNNNLRLERCAQESDARASDDEIRELYKNGTISVWYVFNTYGRSVKHILELCEAIRAEYPEKKDEDMEIWYIDERQSWRHARHTALRVSIPVEDFIKLRNEFEIYIL
jgi:hypothetical protein